MGFETNDEKRVRIARDLAAKQSIKTSQEYFQVLETGAIDEL